MFKSRVDPWGVGLFWPRWLCTVVVSFVVGLASAVGASVVRSFGAGLDLLVPCVLCGFSLWTVSFRFLNCFAVIGWYDAVA